MTERIPALSAEYVLLPIKATINGVSVSPTSDTVEAAIVAAGATLSSGDFVVASWEPNTTSVRVMIGPGTTIGQLAVGTYDCYSRITDNPETPVLYHGAIQVF